MKIKNVFAISLVVMAITITCMGVNRFISPFPDIAVEVIGVITLIDLFILSYSTVKLRSNNK